MKHVFAMIAAILLLAGLAGCEMDHTEQLYTQATLPQDTTRADPEISYNARYIRTDGGEGVLFPAVRRICSAQELQAYYAAYNRTFDLERKEQVYSDTTVGFLDACDGYDEAFFENNYLLFVLLEEGSGSVRHQVSRVQYDSGVVCVFIDGITPEIGTCDMAQWHIIVELSKAHMLQDSDMAQIYLNDAVVYDGTVSEFVYNAEIDDPVVIEPTPATIPGFCGNTQTVLYSAEHSYTLAGDHSVTITALLTSLSYDPHRICKCMPEYTLETEFGSYGVHLNEGYARCEQGQAALTPEQKQQIADIIKWTEEAGGQQHTDETEYPDYPGQWMDKEQAETCEYFYTEIIIQEIYADCFIATSAIPMPYQIKMNGQIAGEWCVGDQVSVTYENAWMLENKIEADLVTIQVSTWEPDPNVCYKPVIYLYPEQETRVTVDLALTGKLTCTYPAYSNGWSVTAAPDGTLTDEQGQTYNYLYWEGETDAQWDMTAGFCVKGADTAAFLEQALEKLGLNRREANEFIVYWLPLMERNPYNVIAFQTDAYTDGARLTVTPEPDSLIRVFMTWQAAEEYVEIPEQTLSAPERTGFTVVEWGGAQLP